MTPPTPNPGALPENQCGLLLGGSAKEMLVSASDGPARQGEPSAAEPAAAAASVGTEGACRERRVWGPG